MSIGLAGAFIGGLLMLLSPCSVMLLPAFFSYAFADTRTLLARTGVFYLGLITTLVPLGVLAGSFGGAVIANRVLLMSIISAVVIVLGIVQLVGIPLPAFTRAEAGGGRSNNLSIYLLGTVYGFAGTCAGPVLGTVLTLTAFSGNALYGGIVLLVFAAGMVVPLAIIAVLWGRFDRLRGWLRPRQLRIGRWSNSWTQVVSGALMIAIGIFLILTEGTGALPSLLGATQQADLEADALDATSPVPDAVIVVAAVVLLGAGVAAHKFLSPGRKTSTSKP